MKTFEEEVSTLVAQRAGLLYGIKVANSSCIISDDRGKNSFELAILSDLERIEDQYGRLKIEINGQKSNFEVNFAEIFFFFKQIVVPGDPAKVSR